MPQITFLFGNHNHQPIGNFGSVFEEAYQKAYRPFAEILLKHPSIRWNLHSTGILWEWLEVNHPEYLKMVKTMVERNQLELLSGGFYEPILPIIPDHDKIGQIEKLSCYIQKHFSFTPKGMWCAERVWEPHLPSPISRARMEYTVLDDNHFEQSGIKIDYLLGRYLAEELQDSVSIFPISKELRYAVPFKEPEDVMEIFKKKLEDAKNIISNPVLTLMDDGEKFGLWPDTYKSVYEELWLEKFLDLLEKNSSWIATSTFSDTLKTHPPLGKAAIPCASYSEMMEWSGGFWRNYFSKYPEANWMHKHMLRVSAKVQDIKELSRHATSKSLQLKIDSAQNHAWASQCNCAYWHGIFGGLYLPILRGAIYKNLIEAERLINEIWQDKEFVKLKGKGKPSLATLEVEDVDGNGKNEILIETPSQNLYFSPEEGGTLLEWDFMAAALNILNPLTRQPEHYHNKLKEVEEEESEDSCVKTIHEITKPKEEGLESEIAYDWYRRAGFIDHFFHPDTTLENFKKCHYGEQGDFVGTPYQCKLNLNSLSLERLGNVWVGPRQHSLKVRKEIEFEKSSGKKRGAAGEAFLNVKYAITNPSEAEISDLWFGCEFCFSFSVFDSATDVPQKGIRSWIRWDPHLHWKMEASFSNPTDLWICPLETVSNSEGGIEKTFQGLIVLPHWKFTLGPRESWTQEFSFLVAKA